MLNQMNLLVLVVKLKVKYSFHLKMVMNVEEDESIVETLKMVGMFQHVYLMHLNKVEDGAPVTQKLSLKTRGTVKFFFLKVIT